MGRFLVLVSLGLLGAGICRAEERLAPSEVLARAVAILETCEYSVSKEALDKNGLVKDTVVTREDEETISEFSLPVLFRPGRFDLSFAARARMPDGSEALVVLFSPRREELQLKANEGENRHYVRAMNHLAGRVFVDPVMGGIMRIEARLPEKLSYTFTFLRIRVFELQNLDFTVEQEPREGKWRPSLFEFVIKYWRLLGLRMNAHDRYTARFLCAGD